MASIDNSTAFKVPVLYTNELYAYSSAETPIQVFNPVSLSLIQELIPGQGVTINGMVVGSSGTFSLSGDVSLTSANSGVVINGSRVLTKNQLNVPTVTTSTISNPTDSISISTGLRINVTQIQTPTYSVLPTDFLLLIDTSAHSVNISLPPVSASDKGRTLIFKDKTGSAATNNITITPAPPATLEGFAGYIFNSNYAVLRLVTDGLDWYVL